MLKNELCLDAQTDKVVCLLDHDLEVTLGGPCDFNFKDYFVSGDSPVGGIDLDATYNINLSLLGDFKRKVSSLKFQPAYF